MTQAPRIDSPCIDICVIDPKSRLCRGCLRSIEEITAWGGMSPEQRRAVMAELPQRRTAPSDAE
ncbi:DUF1289 domain-containing protein [Roseivivax sp. CAU 1761]